MNNPANPTELARETLKTLSIRQIPPTPENYAEIYDEINGGARKGRVDPERILNSIADHFAQNQKLATTSTELKKSIQDKNWSQYLKKIEDILPPLAPEKISPWASLIRDLLCQLETPHKGLTLVRKKEGLETVLGRFATNPEVLFEKLNSLISSWSASQLSSGIDIDSSTNNTIATPTDLPKISHHKNHDGVEPLAKLLDLLAQSLESTISSQPELTSEVRDLIQKVQAVKSPAQVNSLTKPLRQHWLKYELLVSDKAKVHEGLIRLLRLLVANVGEMTEEEEWLHGQVITLQEIISNPMDKNVIADAERSLRDTIINQGLLKQSLTDAKLTLKSLMTTFINRLNEITESTGEYHQKIEGYSQKIGSTNNITELSHLLDDIMKDTGIIQASALRSHAELINTRQQVHQAETEIQSLQQELVQISELVREDQLTGALNRRGLDAAFERESARADRHQSLLCVALLDIDNFKNLNDTLGHQTGDRALTHLCSVITQALRPSDTVARYGGEEFILLLPDANLEAAATTVERLQRELTKKFFMHDNDRVLVTFSAGVAQRTAQESQEDVIGRADKAMYQAKKTGKNRVVMAKQ